MKDEDRTTLQFADDMNPQDFMRKFYQLPHLSQEDAKVEWLAWLVVLGLLVTAILETGCSYLVLF